MKKRQLFVLLTLLALLASLAGISATRLLNSDTGGAADTGRAADGSAENSLVDAGLVDESGGALEAATPEDTPSAVDAAIADAESEPARPRQSLRVVSMGWELLVPGILANGGLAPNTAGAFGEAGLDVRLRSLRSMEQVEAALADGGDTANGAHIAIISLPSFVASYELLRALEPEVFWVAGWSHGRDALYAQDANALRRPPRRDVTLFGTQGESDTLTSLFLLQHAGVDIDRLRLVNSARSANFAAIDRTSGSLPSAAQGRRIVASTADASRLVPYVALASASFITNHPDALAAWIRLWSGGVQQMQADIPGAVRTVTRLDHAPEPVDLLRRLGQVEFSSLPANARFLGLSGRGSITLDALFQETWHLWRLSGALNTPAPARVPMSTGPVISLILGGTRVPAAESAAGEPHFETDPILDRRMRIDKDDLIAELGLLAGVFEHSAIEVGFRGSRARTEQIIAEVCERFNLPRLRFRPLREQGRGAHIILHAMP